MTAVGRFLPRCLAAAILGQIDVARGRAAEPYDPGSVVLIRGENGQAKVVGNGRFLESCPSVTGLTTGVVATADGFVLESFRQGQPSFPPSFIALRGKGCTHEVRLEIPDRVIGRLAFDPEGGLWAHDFWNHELVRFDLDRGLVDRSLAVPIDTYLLGIDRDGTFYVGKFAENVLRLGPGGEVLGHLPTPASFLAVAPDGNVWATWGQAMREYTPDAVPLRTLMPGYAPFAFEAQDTIWLAGEEDDRGMISFVQMELGGAIIETIPVFAPDFFGFQFLVRVPPAGVVESPSPTPSPVPPPTPTRTNPLNGSTLTPTTPVESPTETPNGSPSPTSTADPGGTPSGGCRANRGGTPGWAGLVLLLGCAAASLGLRSRARRRLTVAAPSRDLGVLLLLGFSAWTTIASGRAEAAIYYCASGSSDLVRDQAEDAQ